MSYGPQQVHTLYLASGATTTTYYVDLGRCFKHVFLEVPTMASGSLYIKAAYSPDGTFRRVSVDNGNTSTAHSDFVINSTVTQRMVPVPVGGFRYLKIENSSGATDVTTTFRFIVGD